MKRVLEKLGIYTFNDFICTVGGFLICVLFAEVFVTLLIDAAYKEISLKIMAVTTVIIGLCAIVDKQTK